MGHPPAVKSDLSLVEFLEAIKEFHSKPENAGKTKIVKLDFKSIEATERSIEMLEKDWKKVNKILNVIVGIYLCSFIRLFNFVSFSSHSQFGKMQTSWKVQVAEQHQSMLGVSLMQLRNWEKLHCQLVGQPAGIRAQQHLTHMIM